MQDPEQYLAALGIDVPCAILPDSGGVLDVSHRSLVNWEVYFFSSLEAKERFDHNPTRFCGLVTDPVTMSRFRPTASSARADHNGRPYFFADASNLAMFSKSPDSFAQPNPKMKKYIYTERNGIYIIDLKKTLRLMREAYAFVRQRSSEGGVGLMVGTKKQAKDAIERWAHFAGLYYVNNRWLGGTLTNFQTIRKSINRMIELQDLTKSYGHVQALRGVSTSIAAGEIVGLLGPNGAGKTTAMKILAGYLLPSGGSARIAGIDITADPLAVQRRIGYLPENAPLYGDMLVLEYLAFMAEMRGIDPGSSRRRIGEAAEQCGITEVMARTIDHLSKGYRQRVGLAGTIVHDPEILILDEPTTGLDPNQIVEIRELIQNMGQTKTVILSTHILPEVEASCSRAVILIDGQIRADGTLEELTRSATQVVRVAPGNPAEARALFEGLDGVRRVRHEAGERVHTYRLDLDGRDDVGEAVYQAVRERGWSLAELRRDDRTLEQVFRELTESTAGVAA